MDNYNFNKEKLNEYLNNGNLKSAKDYLMVTEDFTKEEAINFLHLYINQNNIPLKKPTDVNIGYKNLILVALGLIVITIILFFLSFGVIKNIIDNGVNASSVLFIIVLTVSLITCIGYFIILILDIFSKKTISSTGYYNISYLKSRNFKNFVLKFQNGDAIIISPKINNALKNYNYCKVERFKYSKIIKSVTNIK